jgi:hypothetical protein
MKIKLFILLLIISTLSFADVYQNTDENGNISYSDIPSNDQSKRLSNSEISQSSTVVTTSSNPEPNSTGESINNNPGSNTADNKAIKKPYVQFAITSPANETTIQNQSTIPIDVNVDPPLQEGDKIQILLDGIPWGAPNSTTHFEFPQPDRGVHIISAKLIDKNQITLKQSNAVRIYIHRAHIPTQPPAFNQGT